MLTGVMLNWKRQRNTQTILAGWQKSKTVKRAIVWNNNSGMRFRFPWAACSIVNTNRDMGLYTRFAAAALAMTDFVLIQDDDLQLPESTIQLLLNKAIQEPDVIHGIFGRRPKQDGTYAESLTGNCSVPIVLTRALVAHRSHVNRFFEAATYFEPLQRETQKPFGNGEDIIFSYSTIKYSGYPNRIHKCEVKELSANNAIHHRPGHLNHRTKLMQACMDWVNHL